MDKDTMRDHLDGLAEKLTETNMEGNLQVVSLFVHEYKCLYGCEEWIKDYVSEYLADRRRLGTKHL